MTRGTGWYGQGTPGVPRGLLAPALPSGTCLVLSCSAAWPSSLLAVLELSVCLPVFHHFAPVHAGKSHVSEQFGGPAKVHWKLA